MNERQEAIDKLKKSAELIRDVSENNVTTKTEEKWLMDANSTVVAIWNILEEGVEGDNADQ